MWKQQIIKHISNSINTQLTEEEEAIFFSLVQVKRFMKGQFIVQAGDVCKNSTYVVSGSLVTIYLDKEGNRHIVAFAIEDWWTGDYGSFIAQAPADYSVQCMEDCELLQISKHNFDKLVQAVPKLETFFRYKIERAYVAGQRRVVDKNSLTVQENYFKFINNHPELEQRFPQYMIASFLGATPEFISKIRKKMLEAKKRKS